MTELEVEFFDEFKSVDNICADMLGIRPGVTEYINQMEKYDLRGRSVVPRWKEKYDKLKHLRWLRNQIAHGSGETETEETDLIELKRFHELLLTQNDPLALVLKSMRDNSQKTKQKQEAYRAYVPVKAPVSSRLFKGLLLVVGIIFFVIVLLFLWLL